MSTSANNAVLDSYLALIPRGFQHAARQCITEQLSGHVIETEILGEAISNENDLIRRATASLEKQREKSRKKSYDIDTCCHKAAGSSVSLEASMKNLSIGYTEKETPVWSCSGVLSGVVWVKIVTSASVDLVAKHMRAVGPLISLVNVWEGVGMTASQSLKEAVESIRHIIQAGKYPFSEGLDLWHRHVSSAWTISTQGLESIDNKMNRKEAMKYRLSMLRSDSEKYQYTRQEFLSHAADVVVPEHLQRGEEAWKVDLTTYDVEVVILMNPQALAVGFSLRPYQHLKVKSFALGGIPPDVSPPVLPGEILSKLVRLRPTTAQLLLHMAKVEPGDIVLDPCAGVGTIPVEVMFQKSCAVGLGGDLVLAPEALGPIASSNERDAKSWKNTLNPSSASFSNFVAWDATCLPLRTGSVDVVVSDLPFGQQCMSKAKLDGILPLMLSEVARVLRPKTGRIVLLCGNFIQVVRALQQLNIDSEGKKIEDAAKQTIITPFDSIFPANIGGLLAWVIVARRGNGQQPSIQNYRDRVRKLTGKRERTERCRVIDKKSKKRSDYQS